MRAPLRVGLAILLALTADPPADAGSSDGAVYAMTNATAKNEILVWHRDSSGSLTAGARVATGGTGTGGRVDPLGSQGALRLTLDARWLLAVNAGSDELSVFEVLEGDSPGALRLADREPSGGRFPVSVATFGNRVWVLHARNGGRLVTFSVDETGNLARVPGGVRSMSPPGSSRARSPSQIGVTPDGEWLLAVDKAADRFAAFRLDEHGRPGPPVLTPSSGRVPFAFTFVPGGSDLMVAVAEIFGRSTGSNAQGASAVSTYLFDATTGRLRPRIRSLPTGQTALCWIESTGHLAWGTNTGSSTLTAFVIGPRGGVALRPKNGVAHSFAPKVRRLPTDLAIAADGRFLYTLNSGNGSIGMFEVEPDGTLRSIGEARGFPARAGIQGLAAY